MTPHTNDSKAGSWKEDVIQILGDVWRDAASMSGGAYLDDKRSTKTPTEALQAIVEANKKWLIGENEYTGLGPGTDVRNNLREEQRKAME